MESRWISVPKSIYAYEYVYDICCTKIFMHDTVLLSKSCMLLCMCSNDPPLTEYFPKYSLLTLFPQRNLKSKLMRKRTEPVLGLVMKEYKSYFSCVYFKFIPVQVVRHFRINIFIVFTSFNCKDNIFIDY